MSEAAEYPVKDIMVTGNVSLQKNLSGKKSNQRYYYLIVIYYVHQMNGREQVCAHSRSKIPANKVSGTSNINSITSSNVEGVYDLTVVHPRVKHKLHTLIYSCNRDGQYHYT